MTPLLLIATATGALTLDRAIELALGSHEEPRIAAARIEQSRALQREALAAFLPRVSARGQYFRRAREVTREIDDREFTIQQKNALLGTAAAEVVLVDPALFPSLGAASLETEAAELESEHVRYTLAYRVADTFFAALSTERLAEAAERRTERARSVLEDASARMDAGLGQRNDVTRAELEVATSVLERTRAANAHASAQLALERLIGTPVPRELAEPVFELELPEEPDVLLAAALERRGDLRAQQRRVEAAKERARSEILQAVPELTLAGTYQYGTETGFSGFPWDWNVTVGLSWTLYDGGVRYARARAASALADEAEAVSEALRRDLAQQIRQALLDRATGRTAVEQATVRVRLAEQNVEEARLRFTQGLGTSLDVTDAVVAEFESRAELARQGYALRASELALLVAIGGRPGERWR